MWKRQAVVYEAVLYCHSVSQFLLECPSFTVKGSASLTHVFSFSFFRASLHPQGKHVIQMSLLNLRISTHSSSGPLTSPRAQLETSLTPFSS